MDHKALSFHDIVFAEKYHHLRMVMLIFSVFVLFMFGAFLSLYNADLSSHASLVAFRSQYADVEVGVPVMIDYENIEVAIINHMEFSSEVLVQWSAIDSEDRGFTYVTVAPLSTQTITFPYFESMKFIAQAVDQEELHSVDNVRTYFHFESL